MSCLHAVPGIEDLCIQNLCTEGLAAKVPAWDDLAAETGVVGRAEKLPVGGGLDADHHRPGDEQAEADAKQGSRHQHYEAQYRQARHLIPVAIDLALAGLEGVEGVGVVLQGQLGQEELAHREINEDG